MLEPNLGVHIDGRMPAASEEIEKHDKGYDKTSLLNALRECGVHEDSVALLAVAINQQVAITQSQFNYLSELFESIEGATSRMPERLSLSFKEILPIATFINSCR